MKKWALANRSIRIIWAPANKGRKPLKKETIQLIIEMKTLNPKWGAQRISDELAKIGRQVSKKTVLKYLNFYGFNNGPKRIGPSWKEFIQNHNFTIGIDFTSLISLMGHQIYVFVLINIDTRELIFINAAYNPNLDWVKQQFRNAFFDMDEYPTLCICDQDSIFQGAFEKMLKDHFQIKLRRTPIKSPHKNGVTERFHRSLKSEAFENVIPIHLRQTQKIIREYQSYYNEFRPHQGLNGKLPKKSNENPKTEVRFQKSKHLGGKICSFDPEVRVA